MLHTYRITDACCNGVVAVAAVMERMPRNEYELLSRSKTTFPYLLQNNEHAAAEKQLAIHVPTDPIAGNAMQLKAAPIAYSYIKEREMTDIHAMQQAACDRRP